MNKPVLRLGFLATGNGTSFQAVCAAVDEGRLAAEPCLLITNTAASGARDYARERGLKCLVVPTREAEAADVAMWEALSQADVDLVILSGYLRRVGPRTLSRFAGQMLNIHPGPLPQFGGPGMYGRRVHEAVLASGAAETAITIHLVDGEYDHGPVVAFRREPVRPDDTVDTLEARIRSLEPEFFVETLQRVISGDLALDQVRTWANISDNIP